jgi:hypothetical protein
MQTIFLLTSNKPIEQDISKVCMEEKQVWTYNLLILFVVQDQVSYILMKVCVGNLYLLELTIIFEFLRSSH